MTVLDLSSGLPAEKESVVSERPTEPFWAENLLFALYDPRADVGFWLHLGSVPNEWDMWEDRVLVCLPGDEGVLTMWGYYYTPQQRKPAGPNLAFRCIEPFKRWKLTFDGFAQHVSNTDMQNGLVPDGLRKRLVIDLEVDCATPVWDAHTSANGEGGKGEMTTQGWAKEHYEQLCRARGQVRVDKATYDIDATGWRDHSRGPRGGGTGQPWGGHVIASCLYESGKAFVFSSYWRPDGLITLEGAAVVDRDGTLHAAEVLEPPRLKDLQFSGECLPVRLRWAGGAIDTVLETRRSIWTSMQKYLAVGKDLEGPGLMYVLNFGTCEWDREVGQVYIERSDALNAPAERVWSKP